MTIDIQTATSIASLVISIVALFPRHSRDQTKDQKDALAAVSDAYHTTGKYLDYRESHPPDRDREWEIAHKWDLAARLLQPFDKEGHIYPRLSLKSRFWSEGEDSNVAIVQSADIGLASVWRDAQILLDDATKQ